MHHSEFIGEPVPDAALLRHREDNGFDALRLIGAVMVLVGHAFIITGNAAPLLLGRGIHQLGIWLFFAVSGYLITQSWIVDPRPRAYVRKRALRILPGLWLLLAASLLLLGPLATTLPTGTYFADPRSYTYVLKNAVLLTSWSLPGVFVHAPVAGQMNGSLWSLPIEAALYCIVPLAVGLHACSRPVALAALLFAPLVVVAIWWTRPGVLALGFQGLNIGWGIAAAPLFLSGCLLQLVGYPNWSGRAAAATVFAIVALAVGAVLLRTNTVLSVTLALPFAMMVIVVGRSPALHSRLLRRIGDLSYGIYLWAFPVQQLVYQTLGGSTARNITVSVPIVAVLAAASWHLVEKRALTLKRWRPASQDQAMNKGTEMTNPPLSSLKPVHPGELLREEVLPALGKSKTEIARLLRVSRQTLYDILNADQPMTLRMALRVAKLTGTTPESWLGMQQNYDLKVVAAEMAEELECIPTLRAT